MPLKALPPLFPRIPNAKTALEVHRVLAPKAGVKVSPLCLGAMNFGDSWKAMLGECNKTTTFEMLDFFYESGGNFIDTANNYQDEESETWIGEWMKQRGNRDEMVIATKYTTGYTSYHGFEGKNKRIHSNSTGNGNKSLHVSLANSLRKLQTHYVDVLYVHWWDHDTSIEEVMQSLNNLVRAGKVLYLGISDTPAWIVAKANQYARDHGLAQFVVYQGMWNAAERDFERDIIPMGVSEGMAFAPWKSIGGGMFKTEAQRKAASAGRSAVEPPEKFVKVTAALEKLAEKHKTQITSIALAYVTHKAPNVYPIVGGRSVKHLKENIDALLIELSADDMAAIEGAAEFDLGFPHSMIGTHASEAWLLGLGGTHVSQRKPQPITPAEVKDAMTFEQ